MSVYKTPSFADDANSLGITDEQLEKALEEIDQGLHNGDLGGGLIKKRLPRPNQGKSGGFRTIIAYKKGKRAVYLFVFAKNERENIKENEKQALKRLAKSYLGLNEKKLKQAIEESSLVRVDSGREQDEQNSGECS